MSRAMQRPTRLESRHHEAADLAREHLSHPLSTAYGEGGGPGAGVLALQRQAGNRAAGGILQAKLAIGSTGDPLEQAADRAAEAVVSGAPAAPVLAKGPVAANLQRQMESTGPAIGSRSAPPIIDALLRSSGDPLDPATRDQMSHRFGMDMSAVRVHTDPLAGESALAVNALAYTVGRDVVFAPGQYAPNHVPGRRLLAHELAHVVQQGGANGLFGTTQAGGGRTGTLQRQAKPAPAGNTETTKTLVAYLQVLDQTGRIEDNLDSDDKARDVVAAWKSGNAAIHLTPRRKVLLVKEMQSGFTGDDDEEAILDLLERSPNSELSLMFGANRLEADDLLSDFHGPQEARLLSFFGTRFEGGAKAARKGSTKLKPRTEAFGKETAIVRDATEAAEVRWIIKDIHDKYGVDLDSTAGIAAIKSQYSNVPVAVKNTLKTRAWTLDELRALERALAHYAPILGKDRGTSTRAKVDQEITSVSKVEQAIDKNTAAGSLDTTTLGEYFRSSRNFGMFKAGETASGDFPGDVPTQLEGTTVHEIAHGLLEYAVPSFVAKFKYWKSTFLADADATTRIAHKSVEAPPSLYGGKSAKEDLSETAMFYFVKPDRLKSGASPAPPKGTPGNPCPKRYDFMEALVKKWKPKGHKGK